MHSGKLVGPFKTMLFLAGFFLFGFQYLDQVCVAENSFEFIYEHEFKESFEAIFEQYELKDEDIYLEHVWDDYLKSRTHFNNSEYQKACRRLTTQFYQSFSELERCQEEESEQEKAHSSQWMDDLIEQFGKTYVLKNIDLIKLHLGYLYSRNRQKSCEEFVEVAIYRESLYKAASNDYLSLYLDFIESLNEEQRIKLSKRKDALEELRELLNNASIQDILIGSTSTAMRESLYAVAIEDRSDSDAKLSEFFSTHPFFSQPFDLVGCVEDLKKLDSQ
jgi:hypothetical protein